MIKVRPCDPSEAQELIKFAIGSPTPEKVQKILASYAESDHYLLGYYSEGKLVGLIGLQTKETHGVIKHIAVLKSSQKQGIGKMLIMKAIKQFQLKVCKAETDEEGKGFYEKCGFTISAFKGPYGPRFNCILKPTTNQQ